MAVQLFQTEDDGFEEMQYTTSLKDPVARNAAGDTYEIRVLREEAKQQIAAQCIKTDNIFFDLTNPA